MEVDNDRLKSCDTGLQNGGEPNFKNHAGNASIPVTVGRSSSRALNTCHSVMYCSQRWHTDALWYWWGSLPWQPFLAFYVWGAYWCQLANTTEPPMCGGDAALCQITFTTCFLFMVHCGRLCWPSVSLLTNYKYYVSYLTVGIYYNMRTNLCGQPNKKWLPKKVLSALTCHLFPLAEFLVNEWMAYSAA